MSNRATALLARSHLQFAAAGMMIVLVILTPLFAVDLPPLVDLLGHIGRYAIQTGIEDHPWLKQYFSFQWQIIGNLGADLLIELLSPFHDVETSAWMVVLLSQLLAACGILLLCREIHGRITAFCLFALPLIYGFPFNYGFINFTLSMALALLAFTLWLRLGRMSRFVVRAWLFVPISLGVWLCHTFGWAFLGLLCAAERLVRSRTIARDWRAVPWRTGLSCLPLAAPLVPMVLWRGHASATGSTEGWFLLLAKLDWLQCILRLDNVVADKLSAALLFGLVYVGLRSHRLARDRTMATAAALCLVAFLLLPLRVFGSFYADMRLAPYMMIIALLAIDDRKLAGRPRSLLMMAGIAFLSVRLALTTATYLERERILDAHLEALEVIPERARVATLVALPCPDAWELPWLAHVGSLAIARNHAFANDQWANGGTNLLSVNHPEAGDFAIDPSEIVYAATCGEGDQMRKAVMAMPAKAFTHVWIVGLSPRDHPSRGDLTPIWRGSDSAVYQVAGSR